MRAIEAEANITKAIKAGRPVFISGSPGVGKSSIVRKVAEDNGYTLIDVRAALLDPVDLRGLPTVGKDGTTKWNPPSFLPAKGKFLLFLDELPNAPQMVQNALLQLALDRKCGEYTLPEEARVVAAGNRVEDRSGANRLIKSLANRFVHLEMDVDPKDWLKWAAESGIDPKIQGFIGYRPSMLFDFNPTSSENAFASPRSWEFLSDLMPLDPDFDLTAGCIGKGAAAEFRGFLEHFQNLPSEDEIYDDPETAPIPASSNMPAQYAAVVLASERLKRDVKARESKKAGEDFDLNVGKAYVKYVTRLQPECLAFGITYGQSVTKNKLARCVTANDSKKLRDMKLID